MSMSNYIRYSINQPTRVIPQQPIYYHAPIYTSFSPRPVVNQLYQRIFSVPYQSSFQHQSVQPYQSPITYQRHQAPLQYPLNVQPYYFPAPYQSSFQHQSVQPYQFIQSPPVQSHRQYHPVSIYHQQQQQLQQLQQQQLLQQQQQQQLLLQQQQQQLLQQQPKPKDYSFKMDANKEKKIRINLEKSIVPSLNNFFESKSFFTSVKSDEVLKEEKQTKALVLEQKIIALVLSGGIKDINDFDKLKTLKDSINTRTNKISKIFLENKGDKGFEDEINVIIKNVNQIKSQQSADPKAVALRYALLKKDLTKEKAGQIAKAISILDYNGICDKKIKDYIDVLVDEQKTPSSDRTSRYDPSEPNSRGGR